MSLWNVIGKIFCPKERTKTIICTITWSYLKKPTKYNGNAWGSGEHNFIQVQWEATSMLNVYIERECCVFFPKSMHKNSIHTNQHNYWSFTKTPIHFLCLKSPLIWLAIQFEGHHVYPNLHDKIRSLASSPIHPSLS